MSDPLPASIRPTANGTFVIGSTEDGFTCNDSSLRLKYTRGRVDRSLVPTTSNRKCRRCRDIAANERLLAKKDCVEFARTPSWRFFRRGVAPVDLSGVEVTDRMSEGLKAYLLKVKALKASWGEEDNSSEHGSCPCVVDNAPRHGTRTGVELAMAPCSSIADILTMMRAARAQKDARMRARRHEAHFPPLSSCVVRLGRVGKRVSDLGVSSTQGGKKAAASWQSPRRSPRLRYSEFKDSAMHFTHWGWLTSHGLENRQPPEVQEPSQGGCTPTVQEEGSMYAPLTQDAGRRLRSWFPHVIPEFRVSECLACSRSGSFVCSPTSRSSIDVEGNDLRRFFVPLTGTRRESWLSCDLINQYFFLLEDRSEHFERMRSEEPGSDRSFKRNGCDPTPPKVKVFPSQFYVLLRPAQEPEGWADSERVLNYDRVQGWTRRIEGGIKKYDLLLFPVSTNDHWFLVVVDNRTQTIQSYDSFRSTDMTVLRDIRNWLKRHLRDKHGDSLRDKDYEYVASQRQNLPRQSNGYDCGIFCCKFADFLSKGLPIDFDERHMPYFRARMAHEILVGHVC